MMCSMVLFYDFRAVMMCSMILFYDFRAVMVCSMICSMISGLLWCVL